MADEIKKIDPQKALDTRMQLLQITRRGAKQALQPPVPMGITRKVIHPPTPTILRSPAKIIPVKAPPPPDKRPVVKKVGQLPLMAKRHVGPPPPQGELRPISHPPNAPRGTGSILSPVQRPPRPIDALRMKKEKEARENALYAEHLKAIENKKQAELDKKGLDECLGYP